MADDNTGGEFRRQLRGLQLILGALIGGVLMFSAIALTVPAKTPPPAGPVSLTTIALFFGAVQLVARSIVASVITSTGRRRIAAEAPGAADPAANALLEGTGDVGPLFMLYRMTKIVSTALLESAAFFMLVAYMLERSTPALYGAGVMLAAMLAELASVSRFEGWLQRQMRLIEGERMRTDG